MKLQNEKNLTDDELTSVLSSEILKVPDETGIFKGARFSLPVKIGGRMKMVMVMCKDRPYEYVFKNGKKALYVDVFGYGISKPVNITRLRKKV